MNFKNLLLSTLMMCALTASFTQDKAKVVSHLYVTPLHMTVGIAESYPGYHIGIGYERILKNNKWSVHMPVTVGSLATIVVNHHKRNGYNIYFSPGVGYYPKGYTGNNKYHFSAHALIGWSDYSLMLPYEYGHEDVIYTGLLVNAQYNFPISNRTSIITRLGTGLRVAETEKRCQIFDGFPVTFYHTKNTSTNVLYNFNLGLQFKL